MKKKVLIVSLRDDFNMGNRLQNLALQYLIESKGFEVINLYNKSLFQEPISFKLKLPIKWMLSLFGDKKRKIEINRRRFSNKRKKATRIFNENYIHNILVTNNTKYSKLLFEDDVIAIVGSDQVWHNWTKSDKELSFYYLSFIKRQNRNSYAASFGFEDFPEDDIPKYKEGLEGMNKISCRESTGVKLVENLLGNKVEKSLDPTLLLSNVEWTKLLDLQINNSKKKYAFLYFLGNKSEEVQKLIFDYCKQHMLEIIDFNNYDDLSIASNGPKEFVQLIANSEIVFTDSFHGTVFSVIFNKQLQVFQRNQRGLSKMFGRIQELLSSVNRLDSIYPECSNEIETTNDFSKLSSNSRDYLCRILQE